MAPGANLHIVSRWLNRDPSVQIACIEKEKNSFKVFFPLLSLNTALFIKKFKNPKDCSFFPIQTYSNLMIWIKGNIRNVSLRDWGKPYFKFCLDGAVAPFNHPGLVTPRNKMLVLVHIGHYAVHLLRRVPGRRDRQKIMNFLFSLTIF